MPHDVNQSEMDVAAQVRSALVERISSERYELWIPHDTQWSFDSGTLSLSFKNDFSCQLAKRMLAKEISETVSDVLGIAPEVVYDVATGLPAQHSAPQLAAEERGDRWKVEITNLEQRKPISSGRTRRLSSADRPVRTAIAGSLPGPVIRNQTVISNQPVTGNQPVVGNQTGPGLATARERRANLSTLESSRSATSGAAQAAPRPTDLWEQFVQGNSNQLAWTTANLIVSDPGRLSPVVLHGPSGSGKSFLATAVAERLRTVKRMRRVVHMSSEQFTNDYMEGLRGGGLPMFRRKYRDVEALILDDIQFFIGKKSTVGELKHTLDNLLRMGKQVVLTADRGLGDLQALGGELVGRLRSGMVTPIFPLDELTRCEVLTRLFQSAGLGIERHVIEQIAARTAGDGRVLSGIAKRLMAVSSLHTQPLSWDQCWEAIHDLVQATQPVVRIADIERAVCGMFGLEPASLQSENKTRSVSQPRMLAMFLSRKYTPAAYKEIGEYFGKRRHSTVISAEKTVESWLSENANMQVGRGLTVRDAIRQVEAQLQVG